MSKLDWHRCADKMPQEHKIVSVILREWKDEKPKQYLARLYNRTNSPNANSKFYAYPSNILLLNVTHWAELDWP